MITTIRSTYAKIIFYFYFWEFWFVYSTEEYWKGGKILGFEYCQQQNMRVLTPTGERGFTSPYVVVCCYVYSRKLYLCITVPGSGCRYVCLDQGEGQGVVGPGPDVGKPLGTRYQAVGVLKQQFQDY
jgi:hypothetical protein